MRRRCSFFYPNSVCVGLGTFRTTFCHWGNNLLLVLSPLISLIVPPQGGAVKRDVLSVNKPVKKKVTGIGGVDLFDFKGIPPPNFTPS